MTRERLDELKKEFDRLSNPTTHCRYCRTPIFWLPDDGEAMCLTCAALKNEYDSMVK